MKYAALVYAPNTCYTRVVTLEEAKVTVINDRWCADRSAPHAVNHGPYIPRGQRGGVIGVFSTGLVGLNAMVHAAKEATDDHNGAD